VKARAQTIRNYDRSSKLRDLQQLWLLTRRLIDPIYRNVLIPAFGLFGVVFGAWYVGLG